MHKMHISRQHADIICICKVRGSRMGMGDQSLLLVVNVWTQSKARAPGAIDPHPLKNALHGRQNPLKGAN